MAKFESEEYTAPSCWASYLINGDASGIDDSDVKEADAFIESVNLGAPVGCSDESEFMSRPDYGDAGDCLTYSFLRKVET